MKVLIIKTSSLGDLIHTFPGVCELKKHYPNAQIDWVVEDSFEDIVALNKSINKIIKVSTRTWRKNWVKSISKIFAFIKILRQEKYDYVLDIQGLLKSLIITKIARCNNNMQWGYDGDSIRGKYLSWFYKKNIFVNKDLHAIFRIQTFFGKAFNYEPTFTQAPSYGELNCSDHENLGDDKFAVLIPGTTWNSKKWPKEYWIKLINYLLLHNLKVVINSGTQLEFSEILELKQEVHLKHFDQIVLLKGYNLQEKIKYLKSAEFVITVDTGLGHLSAALNKKTLAIFGATNPNKTGILGKDVQIVFSNIKCAPCMLKNCKFESTTHAYSCYSFDDVRVNIEALYLGKNQSSKLVT